MLVDVQKDFFPGGALPVPEGDTIIKPLGDLMKKFRERGMKFFFTRDWHREEHCSFQKNGGKWPVHCVQGSRGAHFHSEIKIVLSSDLVISKAEESDTYSGFEGTNLLELLKEHGIRILVVGGLATDYCVKATVLDALGNDFKVYVVSDGIKGVDLNAGDAEKAVEEMKKKGAEFASSKEILEII